MTKIVLNTSKRKPGVELYFDAKPDQAVRDSLKAHGWRWNNWTRCWWAYDTPQQRAFAEAIVAGHGASQGQSTGIIITG